MATGPDDVRFQGKTGSNRPTTKMTRLTHNGHSAAIAGKPELALPDTECSTRCIVRISNGVLRFLTRTSLGICTVPLADDYPACFDR
jgi:hypothetical protein